MNSNKTRNAAKKMLLLGFVRVEILPRLLLGLLVGIPAPCDSLLASDDAQENVISYWSSH